MSGTTGGWPGDGVLSAIRVPWASSRPAGPWRTATSRPRSAVSSSNAERLDATRRDLAPLLGRGPLRLVHDNQLDLSLVCPEADVLPFIERDGLWWGQPDSSATAITELDRMRAEGASTLAFAAASAWWLEYYGEFADHLRSSFDVLSETPQVTTFDLTAAATDVARP